MAGYAKLFRDLLDKPIFQNEKLLKVWIWCLLKAAYKEREQIVGLQTINLQPGQFVFGRKKAAIELDLTESTAWRLINVLKNNGSLDIKTNNKYSLVTVVNWDLYQGNEAVTDSETDNKWTTDGQQMDTTKKDKKENNNNIYIYNSADAPAEKSPKSDGAQRNAGKGKRCEYTREFESFWSIYPRNADKVTAFAKFKECLKAGTAVEELTVAAQNYANYIKSRHTPEDKILHAKTFLGPAKRYTEFVKGIDLFGKSTDDDRNVQGENAGKPDWSKHFTT